MEKGYFEAQEVSQRKLNMPKYSGREIVIDKNYASMMNRNASDKVTGATVERIDEIVKDLDVSFMEK
ncbi:MAG: hypothetical protein PHZ13_04920 [bacterium]|jgi:hypothetical protein|nr:hypothetical protein [bacterium]MDD3968521.1 hypothetical protein [Proteiniphilum sp.]